MKNIYNFFKNLFKKKDIKEVFVREYYEDIEISKNFSMDKVLGFDQRSEPYIRSKIKEENIKKWNEDQDLFNATANCNILKIQPEIECSFRNIIGFECENTLYKTMVEDQKRDLSSESEEIILHEF